METLIAFDNYGINVLNRQHEPMQTYTCIVDKNVVLYYIVSMNSEPTMKIGI